MWEPPQPHQLVKHCLGNDTNMTKPNPKTYIFSEPTSKIILNTHNLRMLF